jgi:hypothetical protein
MNLNIEGTKHEKAVLVILSYVAGFTAGFIVFGLSIVPSLQSATVNPEPRAEDPVSAPLELQGERATTENVSAAKAVSQVLYKDGRLLASVNGASVLLSAQLQTVDAETAAFFANQGIHEAIPQYLVSDDGNFIYYCEQRSLNDLCTNYVYDVINEIIQFVTLDGVKLESTGQEAKTAVWDGNKLTIGPSSSVSVVTPWNLFSIP